MRQNRGVARRTEGPTQGRLITSLAWRRMLLPLLLCLPMMGWVAVAGAQARVQRSSSEAPAITVQPLAEAAPSLGPVADQEDVAGKAITPVIREATGLAVVTAKGLPAELTLSEVPGSEETRWQITGTPAAAKAATQITLEAEDKEHVTATPVTFNLTIREPEAAPSLGPVADQEDVAGKAITPVIVEGTGLAVVTAKGLPAELTLSEVPGSEETRWQITGTPAAAKAATQITLEAEDKEDVTA